MLRLLGLAALLLIVAIVPLPTESSSIRIGSKAFTESIILGECLRLLCAESDVAATHYREMGGTRILYDALVSGEIDAYPEYTGTIRKEILAGQAESDDEIPAALAQQGIGMSRPLGFNNTYALAMLRQRAAALGIQKISDLARRPELVCGFSNEFMDRQDGWPAVRERYDLSQLKATGRAHQIAYRQLEQGEIDVTDAYSTDAKIGVLDLVLLEDDRHCFPAYEAVILFRQDLAQRRPAALEAMRRLEGQITSRDMSDANAEVESREQPESKAAALLLATKLNVESHEQRESRVSRLLARSIEHIDLVRRSVLPAILIGIPLGVLTVAYPRRGRLLLGAASVVQTIPSLAMLVILMPIVAWFGQSTVGTGAGTAVAALFLYALLPIMQATNAGLKSIPLPLQESSRALGLPYLFRLVHLDLPLASRNILAGVKTSAVMAVGFAALGALIGAGGYGQPIITGIRLNDTSLILEGAIPAALMALCAQGGFDLLERVYCQS